MKAPSPPPHPPGPACSLAVLEVLSVFQSPRLSSVLGGKTLFLGPLSYTPISTLLGSSCECLIGTVISKAGMRGKRDKLQGTRLPFTKLLGCSHLHLPPSPEPGLCLEESGEEREKRRGRGGRTDGLLPNSALKLHRILCDHCWGAKREMEDVRKSREVLPSRVEERIFD